MKKVIVQMCFLLAVFSSSEGQKITVNAGFDTTNIYIGDQITFAITVDQPTGLALTIPELRDTIIKNIEILKGPVIDSIDNLKGTLRIRKEYLVTSFDSGLYQIPPIYAELKNEAGLKRFYSDYSYLQVHRPMIAPPDSTANIFDIIAPYKASLTVGELLPWILLLLLIVVAVYFGLRLYKKYRRREPGQEFTPITEPAHVIAFRELEKLKEEKLWQKGEVKDYYSRLTEILRQYLENRFKVYSLELTTSETLDKLLKTGFKKDINYKKLKTILSGADMVKFAKYSPEPTENESFYEDAWSFVSATKLEESATVDTNVEISGKGGEV
ncbi:MAG TPA: hypothetical protein VMV47_07185 [Bacteroidales bacterium]|nr:hypothetical protein [Bacteroidales bacterium]